MFTARNSRDVGRPRASKMKERIMLAVRAVVGLIAGAMFVMGCAGTSHVWTRRGSDYDEVFIILGFALLFGVLSFGLSFISQLPLPSPRSLARGMVGLHMALHMTQQGVLIAYLVKYLGVGCYAFVAVDLLLMPFVVVDRVATLWAVVYIIDLAVKLALLWGYAFSDAAFMLASTDLGPNGLLVCGLLTIPIIQFFILTSRLRNGSDLFTAYTTNMASVFAHSLHVLDVIEMYMSGINKNIFAGDVQYMFLMLSIMGLIAANLYYVLLFFPGSDADKTDVAIAGAARATGSRPFFNSAAQLARANADAGDAVLGGVLRRPRRVGDARDVASLAASHGTKDETLVHYLLWLVFFVDLPFAALRLVAWWVHNVRLSALLAKNVMMLVASIHLLIVHGRSADRGAAEER